MQQQQQHYNEPLPKMDILYYSNFCSHSQRILDFLKKNGLLNDLNFICIDKRSTGTAGQIVVQLENGLPHPLPPNVNRVPTLLLVKQKNQVKCGNEIVEYLQPAAQIKQEAAVGSFGEPAAFQPASFSAGYSAF